MGLSCFRQHTNVFGKYFNLKYFTLTLLESRTEELNQFVKKIIISEELQVILTSYETEVIDVIPLDIHI